VSAVALLWDVRNCTDMRKNSEGIAEFLSATGAEIMGGEEHAGKFAGWTVDNTRANIAALRILEKDRPAWANQGCIAHGLALAMKDFCKVTRTGGRYSRQYGCDWISAVSAGANTIANYVNDSGNAKALLHKHQLDLWGRHKKIPVSVPTRFATQQFVMKGVLDSKAALVHAASDRLWRGLDGKSHEVKLAC
jgi:hypothetical protein